MDREESGTRAVLDARARELARVSAEAKPVSESLEVVVFFLGEDRYALELACVQEVFAHREITPLPGMPPHIAGIINVRGRILSVVDLKPVFDIPPQERGPGQRVIILESPQMEFGVLADAVEGAVAISLSHIQPTLPTLTGVRADFLKGVGHDHVAILDGRRMLASPLLLNSPDSGTS